MIKYKFSKYRWNNRTKPADTILPSRILASLLGVHLPVADLKETADDVTKAQAIDKTKSAQVMQMFQMTTKNELIQIIKLFTNRNKVVKRF